MIEFTTSTASSACDIDSAAGYAIPFATGSNGPSSRSDLGSQVVRVMCTTSAASLTVVCSLVLVELTDTGTEKKARFPFTATTNAFRSNKDGTGANDYMCDTVFTESGSSKFDLLGHGELVRVSSETNPRGTKTAWYVVVESGLSSGSITIQISDTRAV